MNAAGDKKDAIKILKKKNYVYYNEWIEGMQFWIPPILSRDRSLMSHDSLTGKSVDSLFTM